MNENSDPASGPSGAWSRLVRVKPGEGRALLLAGSYFFFLMLGYYLLRPLRESMGIARGADKLPNAHKLSSEVISIPVFPELAPEQLDTVVAAIAEWLKTA